jgi:hypothetical protein
MMTAAINLPLTEGVYANISNEIYHYAPNLTPAPVASSSLMKTILESNPRTAWVNHPALNPNFERTVSGSFDLGSAAHALILGEPHLIRVIKAKDYRTDAAKAERDKARNEGAIPVLTDQMTEVEAMARAVKIQIAHHEEDSAAFTNGLPEVTLIWNEGDDDVPVWCKARFDWFWKKRDDGTYPNIWHDLKSTAASAGPEWGLRTGPDIGADIQAAWYCRGLRRLLKQENPHFRFVVAENYAPYCLMTHELTPEALEAAEAKVDYALAFWKWCLKHNAFPGYPARTNWIDIPPWKIAEAEALKRLRTDPAEQQELFQMAIEMQAPTEIKT